MNHSTFSKAATPTPQLPAAAQVSHLVGYTIQTLPERDGHQEHRLYIEHRHGRGLIQAPVVDEVQGATPASSGIIMHFVGKDGLSEQLGSIAQPLPREVLDSSMSDAGLEIVHLDMHSHRVITGQVLFVEPEEPADRASARPRG